MRRRKAILGKRPGNREILEIFENAEPGVPWNPGIERIAPDIENPDQQTPDDLVAAQQLLLAIQSVDSFIGSIGFNHPAVETLKEIRREYGRQYAYVTGDRPPTLPRPEVADPGSGQSPIVLETVTEKPPADPVDEGPTGGERKAY